MTEDSFRLNNSVLDACQRLKIDTWPLFETLVHQIDEQTFLIHFSISLVICDALSSGILFQELFTLYKGSLADLPPLQLSGRDYAMALHQHKQSTAYQQAKAYWWNRLDTLPPEPVEADETVEASLNGDGAETSASGEEGNSSGQDS